MVNNSRPIDFGHLVEKIATFPREPFPREPFPREPFISNFNTLRLQTLDQRDVPAIDGLASFTLSSGVECEASFSFDLSQVDPDISNQSIALGSVNVTYDGINLDGVLDGAPSAVFDDGVFVGVEIRLIESQDLVPDLDVIIISPGNASARFSNGTELFANAAPAIKSPAAVGLDLTGITTGVAQTIKTKVTMQDGRVVEVEVEVTADATPGGIRDLIKNALTGKGIICEAGGDRRITVNGLPDTIGKGGVGIAGSDIASIEITSTAPNFVPPKLIGIVRGTNGIAPVYNPPR